MLYTIKRDGLVIASIKPTGTQTRRAMGVDVVEMRFSLPEPVAFELGDTAEVYGLLYRLNRPANETKKGNRIYEYELELEARFYDLAKVQVRGFGITNELTEAQFSIMGNAETLIDLFILNANRIQAGWTKGIVQNTEILNFTFNGENCLQGLNQLADRFESEFWIENQVINFQRREESSGLTLSYGKGSGLYELYRGRKSDSDLITRLYVEGGSRNLPRNYGKTRLQLPNSLPFLQTENLKEVIESTQIFEDIIPERTGEVTQVGDIFTFSDSTLDFDVNECFLPKTPAIIGFQTGQLAGYEFEIKSYSFSEKSFKILLNDKEKAYSEGLPNSFLKPSIGDKYRLFDIDLPESYVTNAQQRLFVAGQAYLEKNGEVQYEYSANLYPLWVKETAPIIRLGNTVKLIDEPLSIDKSIRISGYTRDLQEACIYDLELSDTIEIAEIVRRYAEQGQILQAIRDAEERIRIFEVEVRNIELNAQFITLTGDQTFVYSADINKTVDKETIELTAREQNFTGEPTERLWEYYNGVEWLSIPNTFNTLTFILRHDASIWNGNDSLSIRYRVGELLDQMTIVKLYSGESALTVVIRSVYGDHFFNGNIDTTLSAEVYWGGDNITDTIPATGFNWTRISSDPVDDEVWNFHEGKSRKSVEIDHTDVFRKAVFNCEVEVII